MTKKQLRLFGETVVELTDLWCAVDPLATETPEDSRTRVSLILDWATEFETATTGTKWGEDVDWVFMIDEFFQLRHQIAKANNWRPGKPADLWEFYKPAGRIVLAKPSLLGPQVYLDRGWTCVSSSDLSSKGLNKIRMDLDVL